MALICQSGIAGDAAVVSSQSLDLLVDEAEALDKTPKRCSRVAWQSGSLVLSIIELAAISVQARFA